jgi:hypothetical protein
MKSVPGDISGTVLLVARRDSNLLSVNCASTASRGWHSSGDMSGEERREWLIKNGNFFIE